MFRLAVGVGILTLGVIGWGMIGGLCGVEGIAHPLGQGQIERLVPVMETPTSELASIAAQESATAADSVSEKYLRALKAGGLEHSSIGFHLAEPAVLAARPPHVPWKQSSDGRCYLFLRQDLDAYIAAGGQGTLPVGNASFQGGENVSPFISPKSSVSIRRVIPRGSYTAELNLHSGGDYGIVFHLEQSSRDLLDGMIGSPVMAEDGFDWAHVWKSSGDLVSPFDMVLVREGRSIGFLSALDMILDGTYSGELLDRDSGQPLGLAINEAQALLDQQ